MRHLEEGTIHAWLDGALDAEEARRVEEHVASCAACAGAVAEARGVIAGASRILLALDDVPGGVVPGSAERAPPAPPTAPRRSTVRHDPWWRAIPLRAAAAIMVVAAGLLATRAYLDRPYLAQEDRTARVTLLPLEGPSAAAPAPATPPPPATVGREGQASVDVASAAPARRRPESSSARAERPGSRTEERLATVQSAQPVPRPGAAANSVSVPPSEPTSAVAIAPQMGKQALRVDEAVGASAGGVTGGTTRSGVTGRIIASAPVVAPARPPSAAAMKDVAEMVERSTPREIAGLRLLKHTVSQISEGRVIRSRETIDRVRYVHTLLYELTPGTEVELVVALPAEASVAESARRDQAPEAVADSVASAGSGITSLEWRDPDGTTLQLRGRVSREELEALRPRVRRP